MRGDFPVTGGASGSLLRDGAETPGPSASPPLSDGAAAAAARCRRGSRGSAGRGGGGGRRGTHRAARGMRTGLWTRRTGEVRRGRAGRHRARLPAPGGTSVGKLRHGDTALPGRGHPRSGEVRVVGVQGTVLLCPHPGTAPLPLVGGSRAAGRGSPAGDFHTGVPDQAPPPHSGSHLLDCDS